MSALSLRRPDLLIVARHLLGWEALARYHGLVHCGPAIDDDPVDGYFLSWPDDQDVPHSDPLYGDVYLGAVLADPVGHGGLEVHEVPHRRGGPALRHVLEQPTRKNQGDDDGRGVEVDSREGEEAGVEGDDRGVRPCRRGPEGDERIHVSHPVPDAVVRAPVEAPPDDELDGGLEREEQVVR